MKYVIQLVNDIPYGVYKLGILANGIDKCSSGITTSVKYLLKDKSSNVKYVKCSRSTYYKYYKLLILWIRGNSNLKLLTSTWNCK